jgi:transcriptional regulator with XRE-family HTH domain
MADAAVSRLERGDTDLGTRVRVLRTAAGLTIKQVALRAGLSPSSISKIENDLLSPTYENIIKLARGLGVDIAELFSDASKQGPRGRRSITRNRQGKVFKTRNYDYEMLCTDLVGKKMVPLKAVIKSRELKDFSKLITHDGEELLLVLSGAVELRTEFYEPVVLQVGDCAYFDSTMGHVCLLHGIEEAEVFWVCSSSDVLDLVAERTR